jgi:hypothetical protein
MYVNSKIKMNSFNVWKYIVPTELKMGFRDAQSKLLSMPKECKCFSHHLPVTDGEGDPWKPHKTCTLS